MFYGDMELKRKRAMAKVHTALRAGNGHTLLSTGITGDDARIAKAVCDVGVRMLEPNHPAVALARGHRGICTMSAAEEYRHEITLAQMAEVVRGVRSVVSDDVYITAGIPGNFPEKIPVLLREEDFASISAAGADGLHTHKVDMRDLEQVVNTAHHFGLCVDAYICRSTDPHPAGIFADTPEDVAQVAKSMEDMGVDMIGLMTGMTYQGVDAKAIPAEIKERLEALVETVSVPTLAEGGINLNNFQAFRDTKVNILVVGTSIDQALQQRAGEMVAQYMNFYK
ncbi:MAG: histidine biosynthesis protein [Oscillospiraceae bacterium]|nr:histidine biosynthesis protein [Oscillospiraceae bacterium]MDY5008141.1 histidine biosynthesis protein [Candidatus Fournierella merdipullorum]